MSCASSLEHQFSGDRADDFLYPHDLFDTRSDSDSILWTCVRSRPRWEKKLAAFLRARGIAHYLPVTSTSACTGRKVRSTSLPLFPGFVFVKGDHGKRSLTDSGCIVYVLKPANSVERKTLDSQLRALRQLLHYRVCPEVTTTCHVGQLVTIRSGPLTGVTGKVVRVYKPHRLVVWVDMLGVGVSVVLGPDINLGRVDMTALPGRDSDSLTGTLRGLPCMPPAGSAVDSQRTVL
jgi:transcription antitermination factor NusG